MVSDLDQWHLLLQIQAIGLFVLAVYVMWSTRRIWRVAMYDSHPISKGVAGATVLGLVCAIGFLITTIVGNGPSSTTTAAVLFGTRFAFGGFGVIVLAATRHVLNTHEPYLRPDVQRWVSRETGVAREQVDRIVRYVLFIQPPKHIREDQ